MTGPRWGVAALAVLLGCPGCAGGSPLLSPARALPKGGVRVGAGLSATTAVGEAAVALRQAREQAIPGADVPGPRGGNPTYAKGALASAAVGPGVAPYMSARAGVGDRFEGGIAYTGRALRIDLRRSFDKKHVSLSVGAGLRATLYGRQPQDPLPNVELGALHGYGADLPILAGWQSDGGLYRVWAGARVGWDHYTVRELRSEPKPPEPPLSLDADRLFAGGLVGLSAGFRHLHAALELEASWQSIVGEYNGTRGHVGGLVLTPAAALFWTF